MDFVYGAIPFGIGIVIFTVILFWDDKEMLILILLIYLIFILALVLR